MYNDCHNGLWELKVLLYTCIMIFITVYIFLKNWIQSRIAFQLITEWQMVNVLFHLYVVKCHVYDSKINSWHFSAYLSHVACLHLILTLNQRFSHQIVHICLRNLLRRQTKKNFHTTEVDSLRMWKYNALYSVCGWWTNKGFFMHERFFNFPIISLLVCCNSGTIELHKCWTQGIE